MKNPPVLRIPFTWTERHSVLLEKFLYIPSYYPHHKEWQPLSWSDDALFGKKGAVAIEYCSGNGHWIAERAKQFPETLWVAVEKRFDRAKQAWSRIYREELDNLFIVCGEAKVFTQYYVLANSVNEIFVNFPDPWPKRYHAKHRLIQKDFLQAISTILKKGGKAYFVTDDEVYRDSMIREVRQFPNWQSAFGDSVYTSEWPNYGDSWFCDLWQSKGKSIYYQCYTHV